MTLVLSATFGIDTSSHLQNLRTISRRQAKMLRRSIVSGSESFIRIRFVASYHMIRYDDKELILTCAFYWQRGGIFIEAGANEGEVHSHSLDLELDLGWTGLLVECNPTVTPYLRSKHRKAWVAGVCASTTGFPGVVGKIRWHYLKMLHLKPFFSSISPILKTGATLDDSGLRGIFPLKQIGLILMSRVFLCTQL